MGADALVELSGQLRRQNGSRHAREGNEQPGDYFLAYSSRGLTSWISPIKIAVAGLPLGGFGRHDKGKNSRYSFAKEAEMDDFLMFKKMITPIIIRILFWVGVVLCVILGLISMLAGIAHEQFVACLYGLLVILVGPILCRVYCEILIVMFAINDTLTEMKNLMKNRNP